MKLLKIDLRWVIIGALSIMLIWSMSTCNNKAGQISKMELNRQTTDSILNVYGQTILTQEAVVTNNEQTIKNLTDSIFNLEKSQERRIKGVIAYYKSTTLSVLKKVEVPYVDTVSMKNWEDSIKQNCSKVIDYYEANSIIVPRQARDSTKYYSADLTANLNGIMINKLEISDSQYIRFVIIKGGILKKDASNKRHLFTKKSIQVQVLHTNPLIQVTGQNSAIYIPAKKARWLEKAVFLGAGMVLKAYLDTK